MSSLGCRKKEPNDKANYKREKAGQLKKKAAYN